VAPFYPEQGNVC